MQRDDLNHDSFIKACYDLIHDTLSADHLNNGMLKKLPARYGVSEGLFFIIQNVLLAFFISIASAATYERLKSKIRRSGKQGGHYLDESELNKIILIVIESKTGSSNDKNADQILDTMKKRAVNWPLIKQIGDDELYRIIRKLMQEYKKRVL